MALITIFPIPQAPLAPTTPAAGDTHLGGADFDSRLAAYCAEVRLPPAPQVFGGLAASVLPLGGSTPGARDACRGLLAGPGYCALGGLAALTAP